MIVNFRKDECPSNHLRPNKKIQNWADAGKLFQLDMLDTKM